MTITYQLDGDGGATHSCTPALGANKQALASRVNNTAITRSVLKLTVDELSISHTTSAGNPGDANWALGDYIGSLEVSGNPPLGGLKIRLRRVNSSCTEQEVLGTSSLLTGTGVKSFTVNIDPSAGATGDLYQMIVLGTNNNEQMDEPLTIVVNDVDSKMEGPWTAAAPDRIPMLTLMGVG